jgi:hypothetical protein
MIDYAVASQRAGYAPLLEPVAGGRCEIGAHLHPWVNPPVNEEICARNSYPCNLPPELERAKLRALTDTITANLGVRPKSYKAGRYGIGAQTPAFLAEEGYQIDLSVVPTRDYSADGGPDFSGFLSTRPYWIDGERTLLELPFTTSFIGALSDVGAPLFRGLDSRAGRLLHLPGIFARLGLLNRVGLTPEGVTIAEAKALTRHLLDHGERVFTMAFHSTSLTPGSTPYVTTDADLAGFHQWLDAYFAFFAKEIGGIFMTPTEIYESVRVRPAAAERPPERIASAG